jgi:hypothetical protein
MSTVKSLELTAEQKALIPIYQQKWWVSAFSKKRLDRDLVKVEIATAYQLVGLSVPEVIFFDGPQAAIDFWQKQSNFQDERYGLPLPQFYSKVLKLFFQLPTEIIGSLSALEIIRLQQFPLGEIREVMTELAKDLDTKYFSEAFHTSSALGNLLVSKLAELEFGKKSLFEIFKIIASTFPTVAESFFMLFWKEQQRAWRETVLQQPGGTWLTQIGDAIADFVKPLEKPVWDFVVPSITNGLGNSLGSMFESMGSSSLTSMNLPGNSLFLGVELLPTIDFCIQELKVLPSDREWEAIKTITQQTSWIIPFEKACFVFERPTKLSFDENTTFHAEGEPALKFADGYSMYAYHGVTLPEKYGELHPHQWQSAWVLEEKNAELRRVLIQGIGYGRLCQELNATVLDSWREYTLLRINVDRVTYVNEREVIEEPIHLLKMTCPSTNHIHVLRVPPDIISAREAVRWVNHGVDPESFDRET